MALVQSLNGGTTCVVRESISEHGIYILGKGRQGHGLNGTSAYFPYSVAGL